MNSRSMWPLGLNKVLFNGSLNEVALPRIAQQRVVLRWVTSRGATPHRAWHLDKGKFAFMHKKVTSRKHLLSICKPKLHLFPSELSYAQSTMISIYIERVY